MGISIGKPLSAGEVVLQRVLMGSWNSCRAFLVASLDLESLELLFQESDAFSAAMQAAGCRPVLALRNATQVTDCRKDSSANIPVQA